MRTSTKSCFKRSKANALSSAPPAAKASPPSATPKTPSRPLLPGRVTGTIPTTRRKDGACKEAEDRPSKCRCPDTKGSRQETRGSWQSHKASTYEKPGLPQDLVPTIYTKTKKVPDICKASILGSSQGEPVLSSCLHQRGETYPPPTYKTNPARAGLLIQAKNQVVHHKASTRTCHGLLSCNSTLHLNRGRAWKL